jgi:hypothetical protein
MPTANPPACLAEEDAEVADGAPVLVLFTRDARDTGGEWVFFSLEVSVAAYRLSRDDDGRAA